VADLAELSQELAHELPAPLRMGIGIHVGHAVVGRMGYGPGVYLTAVGDTVHVASRLEQLTKDYDCELVITEEVARHAGIDTRDVPRHELTVRNRGGSLAIYTIARVAMLPAPAVQAGILLCRSMAGGPTAPTMRSCGILAPITNHRPGL
jgi:adenylate cyclase